MLLNYFYYRTEITPIHFASPKEIKTCSMSRLYVGAEISQAYSLYLFSKQPDHNIHEL